MLLGPINGTMMTNNSNAILREVSPEELSCLAQPLDLDRLLTWIEWLVLIFVSLWLLGLLFFLMTSLSSLCAHLREMQLPFPVYL